MDFLEIFVSEEKPHQGNSRRDKFLSRIFGIFNEEIVRIWCSNNQSPFSDLGRPTVYDRNGKHYTLDFLLKDSAGNVFLTEMKCELEYQKYRYLSLSHPDQLNHHRNKRAFQIFLDLATSPDSYQVRCKGDEIVVGGSALIWGRVSEQSLVMEEYSFAHILSVESIINDLINWQDSNYLYMIDQHEQWCREMFTSLKKIDDVPFGNRHQ